MFTPNGANQRVDSDRALIDAVAGGDTQALEALYARYGSAILNFLVARLGNPQLAEEVLQDVMLAVWRSAGTFRGDSKVLTWLLTIARNRAINATRKKRPTLVELNEEISLRDNDTGPLEHVIHQGQQAVIRDAIQQLPAGQREVLVLVFYHQMTGAEIAEILDITPGTVKSRLHRAKQTLRRLLQGNTEL
jgi:RNA polymerase sigma-70 factor (ECF subfamily)